MNKSSLTLIATLLISSSTLAADLYDPKQNYSGGSQVSFNGSIYQAKWWANPGQSPGDKVEHAWETPWELIISETDPESPLPPDPETPTEPVLPPVEGYPDYLFGTEYSGNQVVHNKGKLYQCRDGVTVPWCSGAAWAYEPGVGTAWFDAWVVWDGS
ncbi:carbohydrate-binding protein, partial [Shewanella waksmanii]|uniref:carbohydrate-binding protein n=1 Tax=Shewanella waksmanii TaxID=213783 RepID=UPI0037363622